MNRPLQFLQGPCAAGQSDDRRGSAVRQRRQGGFAAVAAIFLVVTLAALGGFMVSLSNTQQLSSAQDTQGIRAYWAARAGIEWGLTSAKAATACPAASSTLSIEGFSVVVTCSMSTYSEGASSAKIFSLGAQASSGTAGTATYVERSLSVGFEM